MGGINPSIALQGQVPQLPGPIDNYEKGLSVQSLINQSALQKQALQSQQVAQQQQQLQLQQQQDQYKDTQTLRSLSPSFVKRDADGNPIGYDYNGLLNKASTSGVSPIMLSQLRNQYAESVKNMAGADEAVRNNDLAKNKASYEIIEGLKGITDPEQRATAYQQGINRLKLLGADTSSLSPNKVPDNDTLTSYETTLGMHGQMLADAKTQADTQAEQGKGRESAAKAALDELTLKLRQGVNPEDFHSAVNQVAPPTGATAGLNARTRANVDLALKSGDIEGARKAVNDAATSLNSLDKETSPQMMGFEVRKAAVTDTNKANIQQEITNANRPVLAFDKQNKAHLLSQGDAAQAGYTGVTQASDKDIQDSRTHNVVLNDMQAKLNDVVNSRKALDQGAGQRAIISKVLSHAEPGLWNDAQRNFALKGATQLTKDYLINVQSLKESALGLPKEITGGARTSDIQGNALFQTLPSGASVDSKYALEQSQKFQANIDRLRDRVPQIRGMQPMAPHSDLSTNPSSDAAKPSLQVGQTVSVKGKQMKIIAVHPDGSFDAK